jgi:hypothetical protein
VVPTEACDSLSGSRESSSQNQLVRKAPSTSHTAACSPVRTTYSGFSPRTSMLAARAPGLPYLSE